MFLTTYLMNRRLLEQTLLIAVGDNSTKKSPEVGLELPSGLNA